MNEVFIYELYRNILKHSKTIEGRFVVCETGGQELNTSSMDELIKDQLGGLIATQRKYPLVAMFPPVEVDPRGNGWMTFKNDLFFLTPDGRNGDKSIKSMSIATNTSDHPIYYDWKDMKEAAWNFRRMLNNVCRTPAVMEYFREDQSSPDIYTRFALVNNDRLNAVRLQFDMKLFKRCDALTDYAADAEVVIPDYDPHPLHKH